MYILVGALMVKRLGPVGQADSSSTRTVPKFIGLTFELDVLVSDAVAMVDDSLGQRDQHGGGDVSHVPQQKPHCLSCME